MAKKKTSKKIDTSVIDLNSLAEDAGLVLLHDSDYATIFDRLPTFFPQLDRYLGGGLPFGRMVEIAGANAAGKSTLAFHIARVATLLNCIVVLIDVEGTADKDRLTKLGIDTRKILVKQPDEKKEVALMVESVGRTIEETIALFKKKYPDTPIVYIWDSLGQTPSEVEMDKDFGDKNVGARAAAISQLIYKVGPLITSTKSLFIAINQVRADIGGNQMFAQAKMPGGKAWEHYASLRIEVQKGIAIKKGEEKIGHNMKIKINKSKVSRPHTMAELDLISDDGIPYERNIARLAEEAGILGGTSQSYEYVDNNGEIHKKRKDLFITFMQNEGAHVREELLNKLVQLEFPEGHPALKNATLSLDGWVDKIYPSVAAPLSIEKDDAGLDADADALIQSVQDEIDSAE
ncbi:putative DNA recombination and repair protein RecA [Bacillus phage Bp8p-C]|uniref:Putative DNA recombination and repair protein RecA n=2 Tax=Agatevirus Bp8pC TaxID=1910937 RepID=A0A0A0PLH6_9CAUD|nr:UvsX-like recombinase [Bacillus phage Bp8p-C]YP_009784362.1 putative DNA recombination and repair protein RecA [Bacillus phage Bp8p-T]AHJ87492.1 putative DNA recombination and repair protein RecA [Bacillus phage Bp8p-C]AHJ87703.1 putative DNA recombination and repair protein RecA [Bacillus phage Bp8p-T]